MTSGQQQTAWQGRKLLAELIEKANNEIQIMPGGGINIDNIIELATITGAQAFHLSAKKLQLSDMRYQPEAVRFSLCADIPEYDYELTSAQKVLEIKQLLKDL